MVNISVARLHNCYFREHLICERISVIIPPLLMIQEITEKKNNVSYNI